jgi:predicted ester cyclase
VALVLEFMERSFNQGDLSVIDEQAAPDGVDHQEPPGTNFAAHLKEVVMALRTGFPDLHFEIHHILADGEIVAFHSTMTGTHTGTLSIPGTALRVPGLPPTGRKVSVAHMHFVRMVDGKSTDLWHVWDTPTMLRQLGVVPAPQARPA